MKHFSSEDERRQGDRRAANDGRSPPVRDLVTLAKQISAIRSARNEFLDSTLLSEPGYDMLLALFIAEAEGRPLRAAGLLVWASVPSSTTLRWLRTLEELGLVIQIAHYPDLHDHFVELRPKGLTQISRHLDHAWRASGLQAA